MRNFSLGFLYIREIYNFSYGTFSNQKGFDCTLRAALG